MPTTTMRTASASRYAEALQSIPPPGCGCHPFLLKVANFGILAGLDPEQILDDIRQAIPLGDRPVGIREIEDAIRKASADGVTFKSSRRLEPFVSDGKKVLQRLIEQGPYSKEADLWEVSPVRLIGESASDAALFLDHCYYPDDLLFIGDRVEPGILGKNIQTAAAWITHFKTGGKAGPHIIPNPLTGTPIMKKAGDGKTLRGDGNIASYRFCMAEFDNLSREDQIKFWSAVKLPIIALIDSGGKSIHAWLDIQKMAKVMTPEQWQAEIKIHLYDRILTPLGVDPACFNPARLSRLPGHYRTGKGAYQRLLWLSPEGRSVC